jgi:hypothetical protein
MGSSGMKRRGRRHLPKVGTRPAMEQQLEDRRERALHPFAEDPWQPRRSKGVTFTAIAVGLIVAIGAIAIMLAT